jgi:hypothetical protein
MSNDAMLMIVVSECKHAVEDCIGGLEDKLRAAMNAAKNHWMVLDKDTQFRGAVGAVMIHYGKDSEEYKRLAYEVDAMRKLSAFISAAQADLSVELPETSDEPRPEPVGIMKLWQEANA